MRFEISRGVRPGEERKPIYPDAFWVWARDEDVRRVEIRLEEKPAFDFDDFTVIEDTDRPRVDGTLQARARPLSLLAKERGRWQVCGAHFRPVGRAAPPA